jgi:DNA-directed RNA polymerase subunit beta'
MQNKNIPLTGPAAIEHALSKINLEGLKQQHLNQIKSGAKSKRTKSVQALNAIEGLQRNGLTPEKLLIRNVPVIPPAFRPFSVVGNAFVPGDANELYRDLFQYRDVHGEAVGLLGDKGAAQTKLDLYDTVKALYGYGTPIAPKTKQRGIAGFLTQVTGSNPKYSYFQRKLISKPQDSVARGTIAVDPELSLDEIGVPLDMAWVMYAPYIQRRLVQNGMSAVSALQNIKDRTQFARKALDREVAERPVVYSRAPSWHKFNVLAGKPKLIDGNTIAINPLVTTGLNADFDGDAMNLHVPSQPEAVQEAMQKLMPSKMLFSIRSHDQVVPLPKQELILGLFTANRREAKNKHTFKTEDEALRAIRTGAVNLSDEIEIAGKDQSSLQTT